MSNFSGRQPFEFHRAGKVSKNRMVLAPMTHNMSLDNGDLSDAEITWLKRCAEGGFGMVITAATMVSQSGRSWQGQPGLLNDRQLGQFKQVADCCRANNALSIVQLHHGGMRVDAALAGGQPFGPSEHEATDDYPNGVRALSNSQIEILIDDFVQAAIRAHKAGFDGVELHAAHNYALGNFLNPVLNRRKGEFGGDLNGRANILFCIIERIRKSVSRDLLIGIRLSPESYGRLDGICTEEQVTLANRLAQLNADYVHMSMIDVFKQPAQSLGGNLSLLEWIKNHLDVNMPLIVAGKITDIKDADMAVNKGADLVAIGTTALGNPDWVNQTNAGLTLNTPPYTRALLRDNGFNEMGIDYIASVSGAVEA